MYAAPEHLSKFYLSAYLDSLKGSGWSIFLVRGDFPKECPVNGSNGYGRWLTPEDAKKAIIAASRKRDRRKGIVLSDDDDDEDDDGALKDAIAASLRDSSTADEKQPESSGNENENENVSQVNEKQPDSSENENENTKVEKGEKKSRVEG
ncbi:putative ataxin-3 homolog [Phtheirospermum japonicum]|uniref:Putative ataxin-3 homolog n=1 Tax=Phtheirospermum japonicum TaxID=374723 RepID=A0A830DNN1_9LAMI|nr:putative ataxin-3 homolog [Phtheirospermum japonicum]